MPAKLQTAVLGASGYSGAELTRLLLRHPRLEMPVLLKRDAAGAGESLAAVCPEFTALGDLPLEPLDWPQLKKREVQAVFLATPQVASRSLAAQAIQEGIRVIDLSGAWRLKNAQNRAVYAFPDEGSSQAKALEAKAVYGLPELHHKSISSADLVANPGCYATSVILALAPLMHAGMVDQQHGVISDSKSGVSGAGKETTARTHFVSVTDNLSAYSVLDHRHRGEMLEQLGLSPEQLAFTPHLLPIPRGILSTIYVRLKKTAKPADIEKSVQSFYAGKPWIRLFPATKLPEIRFCLHTNYCDLGFCLADDGQRLVLISCLDNLLKGAAGQAVQNLNVMYGWNEKEGLN